MLVVKENQIFLIFYFFTKKFRVNNSIYLFFSKIQQIISSFCSSLHVELQQRGVEFSQLFGKYSNLRPALLERMPPMEVVRQTDSQINGDVSDVDTKSVGDSPQHVINTESVSVNS